MTWLDVGGLIAGSNMPKDTDDYLPYRSLPQKKTRWGFDKVIAANGIDSAFGSILWPGTGQTISQSAGALVLTTGSTNYAETVIRSAFPVYDAFTLRWSTVLSQRVAAMEFIVELVDVIGNNLAFVVNSTTSITVTIPNNPFTAANIGQSMSWFQITGPIAVPTTVPITIASVSGNDVTFTTAWSIGSSSGSGTSYVFGWNYHRIDYTGTTATSTNYRTQRNGWPGTNNGATINTTASPGHIGVLNAEDGGSTFADQLRASSTGLVTTIRAQEFQYIPDGNVQMYLQIRVQNGGTPSATTWTIGFVDLELYVPQQVSLVSTRPQSPAASLNANISNTIAVQPARPTAYSYTTTASTNATLISSTTTRNLLDIVASNPTATACYLKLFAKTTAPTVGTDVPAIIIPVPANSTVQQAYPWGRVFAGLGFAVTGGIASLDNTNAPAGVLISASYL